MTTDSADYRPHHEQCPTVDEVFQGVPPMRSADDLAQPGVFETDAELEEFLADLREMRRADLA